MWAWAHTKNLSVQVKTAHGQWDQCGKEFKYSRYLSIWNISTSRQMMSKFANIAAFLLNQTSLVVGKNNIQMTVCKVPMFTEKLFDKPLISILTYFSSLDN